MLSQKQCPLQRNKTNFCLQNVTGEQIHGPTLKSLTDESCQRDLMETNTPKKVSF